MHVEYIQCRSWKLISRHSKTARTKCVTFWSQITNSGLEVSVNNYQLNLVTETTMVRTYRIDIENWLWSDITVRSSYMVVVLAYRGHWWHTVRRTNFLKFKLVKERISVDLYPRKRHLHKLLICRIYWPNYYLTIIVVLFETRKVKFRL